MSELFDRVKTLKSSPSQEGWEQIVCDMFAYMDKDGDGKVSVEEHAIWCDEFSQYIISSAPEESREEVKAKIEAVVFDENHERNPTKLFKTWDADSDGFLTVDELKAGMAATYGLGQ